MMVGMTAADVETNDHNDAGKDNDNDIDNDDNSDETLTTINLFLGNGQPWAWQRRLLRRFGRRWLCRVIVIVLAAVERTTMT